MRGAFQTLVIAATELRVEGRSRRVVTTMVLLATLSVVTFGFAGRGAGSHLADAALWVSLLVAVAAGAAQLIGRDQGGLPLAIGRSPAGGAPFYLGRVLAFFTLTFGVALVTWLEVALLFDRPKLLGLGRLMVLCGLASLGLAALAVAVVAQAGGNTARLAYAILLPLGIPVILGASLGTRALSLDAGALEPPRIGIDPALALLGGADALLLALGTLMSRGPALGGRH